MQEPHIRDGTGGGATKTNNYTTAPKGQGYTGKQNGGSGGSGAPFGAGNPQNGTGGLLIVYADTICGDGSFQANGSSGGYTIKGGEGGSSGGGSINIFYRNRIFDSKQPNLS